MQENEPDLFAAFAKGQTRRRAKLPEKVSAKLRLKKTRKWFRSRRAWRRKYRAYLQSPEWKAKRQERLKICQGLCEYCKVSPAEHIHHLTYKRVFNEDIDDLRGICLKCHEQKHPGKRFRKLKKKTKKRAKPFTGTHFVEF